MCICTLLVISSFLWNVYDPGSQTLICTHVGSPVFYASLRHPVVPFAVDTRFSIYPCYTSSVELRGLERRKRCNSRGLTVVRPSVSFAEKMMRGGSKGSCEKFGGRVELMSQCWWHEETVGLPIMSKGDVPTVTGRHCIVHNLRSSKCFTFNDNIHAPIIVSSLARCRSHAGLMSSILLIIFAALLART